MDKLDCIKTFVSVVEHGNFSKASRNLGITRDQVAKRICFLETFFNTLLFTRNTRSMSLTQSGEKLYQRSQIIMGEFEWAINDFNYDQKFPGGILRINVPHSFQQTYLTEIISKFMSIYPLIKVELNITDKFQYLNENNYDITLRVSHEKNNEPLGHIFSTYHINFYATKTYFQKYGKPKILKDLQEHKLLLYSQSNFNNKVTLTKNKKEESIYCTPYLTCNNGGFLLDFCKKNLGITYIPNFLADREVMLGNIIQCLEDYHSQPLYFYVTFPSTQKKSKNVELFLDHLKKHFPDNNNSLLS